MLLLRENIRESTWHLTKSNFMKTPVNYLIIISLLAIITFSGCKKGGSPVPEPVVPDTTKPTINITKPTAGQSLTVGSLLTFQATFSDNVQLKSYEIVISKVIAGGLTLKSVPTPVDWSYTKSASEKRLARSPSQPWKRIEPSRWRLW